MQQTQTSSAVPGQYKGAESFTKACKQYRTNVLADAAFGKACTRLFDINRWNEIAGGGAIFRLADNDGNQVLRQPAEGDLISINISSVPANDAGDGREWVRIENITGNGDRGEHVRAIVVRPCNSPLNGSHSTAHFFTPDATSTFMVTRHDKEVCAMVIGKNETPNTNAQTLWDRVRNVFVGLAAMAGLNKPQWKKLVRGFLD